MFDERICLGLPSLPGHSLPDALQKARELGFQSIMALPSGPNAKHSLGPFPTLEYDNAEKRDWLKSALAGFSRVSIHQAWNQNWQDWIDCAVWVGAKLVTVHAGLPQGDGHAWLADRARHWRTVGDYAHERGIRIGIENEGGSREAYLQLIREIDHPAVGATVDLGHCAYFDEVVAEPDIPRRVALLNDLIVDLLRELGNETLALHVHNVRAEDWRDHRHAARGAIDISAAFEILAEVGFAGSVDIELEEPDMDRACAETGAFLDDLLRARTSTRKNH
jgi:sugar phosphate isomerase/epimerase